MITFIKKTYRNHLKAGYITSDDEEQVYWNNKLFLSDVVAKLASKDQATNVFSRRTLCMGFWNVLTVEQQKMLIERMADITKPQLSSGEKVRTWINSTFHLKLSGACRPIQAQGIAELGTQAAASSSEAEEPKAASKKTPPEKDKKKEKKQEKPKSKEKQKETPPKTKDKEKKHRHHHKRAHSSDSEAAYTPSASKVPRTTSPSPDAADITTAEAQATVEKWESEQRQKREAGQRRATIAAAAEQRAARAQLEESTVLDDILAATTPVHTKKANTPPQSSRTSHTAPPKQIPSAPALAPPADDLPPEYPIDEDDDESWHLGSVNEQDKDAYDQGDDDMAIVYEQPPPDYSSKFF